MERNNVRYNNILERNNISYFSNIYTYINICIYTAAVEVSSQAWGYCSMEFIFGEAVINIVN